MLAEFEDRGKDIASATVSESTIRNNIVSIPRVEVSPFVKPTPGLFLSRSACDKTRGRGRMIHMAMSEINEHL